MDSQSSVPGSRAGPTEIVGGGGGGGGDGAVRVGSKRLLFSHSNLSKRGCGWVECGLQGMSD